MLKEKIIKLIDRSFFKIIWKVNPNLSLKTPEFIKIETTNLCNGNCKYCPHSSLKREKSQIS